MPTKKEISGIALAVERMRGTRKDAQAALAEGIGSTQQAVSAMLRRGWASPKFATKIHALTGVPLRRLVNPAMIEILRGRS